MVYPARMEIPDFRKAPGKGTDAVGMRILMCGAGRITRELLKALGSGWKVTIIDKQEKATKAAGSIYPDVVKTFTEDATSPVVLDHAGMKQQDYVLALMSDDESNLVVARQAVDAGIKHVLSIVRDPENLEKFRSLDIRLVPTESMPANSILHYLQDPGIHVTPLVTGDVSVFELDAADHFRIVGRPASAFNGETHRLVGIMRGNELVFPDDSMVISSDDRLMVIGKPETFKTFCALIECGNPHFPLAFGQGLLLALPAGTYSELSRLLNKGLYLAQNTQVKRATVLCPGEECGMDALAKDWPLGISLSVKRVEEGSILDAVRDVYEKGTYGLVVVPPLESGFLRQFGRPRLISLSHELGCPVLVARFSMPYERILVPFSGTTKAEQALGIAVDIAKQLDCTITVAVVEEPEIISGEEEGKGTEQILTRIRELSRIHKMTFEEVVRRGNPVKELVKLSGFHDLLVVGATSLEPGIFSANVGEHLAEKASCSVLIVAG